MANETIVPAHINRRRSCPDRQALSSRRAFGLRVVSIDDTTFLATKTLLKGYMRHDVTNDQTPKTLTTQTAN